MKFAGSEKWRTNPAWRAGSWFLPRELLRRSARLGPRERSRVVKSKKVVKSRAGGVALDGGGGGGFLHHTGNYPKASCWEEYRVAGV